MYLDTLNVSFLISAQYLYTLTSFSSVLRHPATPPSHPPFPLLATWLASYARRFFFSGFCLFFSYRCRYMNSATVLCISSSRESRQSPIRHRNARSTYRLRPLPLIWSKFTYLIERSRKSTYYVRPTPYTLQLHYMLHDATLIAVYKF